MAPLLELERISVQFGGLRALSDLSLTVEAGSMVAVIGPNGAGKTTAFNVITGVCKPSAGQVRLRGERLDGQPPYRICARGVARTFQNIRLFRSLTVVENIEAALIGSERSGLRDVLRGSGWRLREAARRKQAQELLEQLALARFAGERADSLPYGEQRRLEIARALATRPELLLLDEPAAGTNPSEKEALRHGIAELRERFGLTVLLIDHDIPFVMNLCERVAVLDHGEKIAEGTPEMVQRDPKVIEAYLGPDGDPLADPGPELAALEPHAEVLPLRSRPAEPRKGAGR